MKTFRERLFHAKCWSAEGAISQYAHDHSELFRIEGGIAMTGLLNSVVEAIGQTPLVRLDRLTRAYGVGGAIPAKPDYLNAGFSKKDRAARGIIEEAERDGTLRPGQTVCGAHFRESGNRSGDCLCDQGLPFSSRNVEGQFRGTRSDDARARG